MHSPDADIIFAGGGLASCLTALRVSEAFPEKSILIIEAGDQLCGNHTWSFHRTDLNAEEFKLVEPMIAYRWPGQQVIFPDFHRKLSTGYASLTSESVRNHVKKRKNIATKAKRAIAEIHETSVTLEDGQALNAPCIIDGRGFRPDEAMILGFQKFIGLELELEEPHGEAIPTIMDASVEQFDGYRFVYTLPFDDRTVLIEDTRYSDHATLDEKSIVADIKDYARSKGWKIKKIVRQEDGVLPITLGHDCGRFWRDCPAETAPIGLRAGLFHPTTGYSLPNSVKLAGKIAAIEGPMTTGAVRELVEAHAHQLSRQQSFYRFLNRMLFKAAEPGLRWKVLSRFYKLSQGLIERFYSDNLTFADRSRILIGKPPVPVSAAISCISEKSVFQKTELA
ncbi:MAG: lycopene beta-cyclase CrtY [Pseudomonadota bacterium]